MQQKCIILCLIGQILRRVLLKAISYNWLALSVGNVRPTVPAEEPLPQDERHRRGERVGRDRSSGQRLIIRGGVGGGLRLDAKSREDRIHNRYYVYSYSFGSVDG